jgi:hypothetical protein
MSFLNRLGSVSDNVYVIIFLGVAAISLVSLNMFREGSVAVEKKILSRQRDLSQVLQLRDIYEARKKIVLHIPSKSNQTQRLSLGLIESLVQKNFVSGKLTTLQPAAPNEEKGKQQRAVEVQVADASLGEIVSFLNAAHHAGLSVRKLRLLVPEANPATLELSATLSERFSHE